MYDKLPHLILAFHGCDISTYNDVLINGNHLKPSMNDYDWLGNGIYFWESNRQRAFEWAEEQVKLGKYKTPAVIGAVIDLGRCMNLKDSKFIDMLKSGYHALESRCHSENREMPKNTGGADKLLRKLDCAVIEQAHDIATNLKKKPFDSVRGLFIEGANVYPGSGFKAKTHIQICVRNPNCIKGYFNPLNENLEYNLP
ncbi:MAG: hypothetical protein FWG87_09235 [Defluviitaleaceae bacterium]|nr:hypothetical protein [Defluviitaleaceae bacterium]